MKQWILIGAAILMIRIAVAAGGAQPGTSDRDRLAGAWKLVSLEQPRPDGQLNKLDCCGMFVFTRDGHLSVQVMERGPKPQSTSAGPEQYSQGGYEASYGSYLVDEKNHTFTFHVEGALVGTLIGRDLPRVYEFKGNQLIVKSARLDEHWRVVWEHY